MNRNTDTMNKQRAARQRQLTARARTRPKPKRIGLYELVFYVGMMETTSTAYYRDPTIEAQFRENLQRHCPHLMEAIKTNFSGDEGRDILFTHDISAPPDWYTYDQEGQDNDRP